MLMSATESQVPYDWRSVTRGRVRFAVQTAAPLLQGGNRAWFLGVVHLLSQQFGDAPGWQRSAKQVTLHGVTASLL